MNNNASARRLDTFRPCYFPDAAMPAVVSVAFLFCEGTSIRWSMATVALITLLLLQVAGSFWDKYYSTKDKELRTAAIALCVTGLCLVARLISQTGAPMFWLILAGALLAFCYPWVKNNVAGDVAVLLGCGFIPGAGMSLAATGTVEWRVLMTALPAGLVTCAILHAGITGKIPTDDRADISSKTALGSKVAAYLYWCEVIVPYVVIGVLSMASILPVWTVFIFLTFPVALGCARAMVKSITGGTEMIADLRKRTANLQLMFSVMLALSLFLAGLSN
ncbi:MAG: prenyltransferase [Candidatus Cryptobacteroides sp.]